MRLPFSELIACDECDALHWRIPLGRQAIARCTRCGATLYQGLTRHSIEYLLIITLTSLILFVIANSLPIVELKTKGLSNQTTLIGGIAQLWLQKMPIVAAIAFCVTIFCPLIELAGLVYLLVPLCAGHKAPGFSRLLRVIQAASSWAMIEVLMLGALVTCVKLSSFAHVIPGPALFALGGLTFSFTAIHTSPRRLWHIADVKITDYQPQAAFKAWSKNCDEKQGLGSKSMASTVASARQTISARCAGLVACRTCGHTHRYLSTRQGRCACCGATLYSRKPHSLGLTWSLLATVTLLIMPASFFPVMHRQSIFGIQDDTVISGMIYFWTSGSWALASILFIASFLVPMLKLAALSLLAYTAQFGLARHSLRYAKLYRLIKCIGHWSMLDIFVMMFTVVLVQFRPMVAMTVGPGALAFGLVAVLTMLASMQFDSRLIWDHHDCTIR